MLEETIMQADDWKAMYMILFHGITDSMELLPVRMENAKACERLSQALQDAEAYYIDHP